MSLNIFKLIENGIGLKDKTIKRLNVIESSIILKNNLNKAIFKSKCRDILKDGNLVQLCSRSSHRSLQICSCKENKKKLIFMANGPVGDGFPKTHFLIEKDTDGYLSFKSKTDQFYLNFCDNFSSNIFRNSKYEKILDDTKFRLHEVLGSNEYFALESIKYKGRFLACHPNGVVTTSRNSREENTHFFLNRIHADDMPTSLRSHDEKRHINYSSLKFD
jgi:protein involved in sex pheromone biosynthesis